MVGVSPIALSVCGILYVARMFGITGFYHRYFSHRTFKTSRVMQFFGALLGNSSGQRGPIWWAAHHRYHHQVADTELDPHSPQKHGLLMSHVGWILTHDSFRTRWERAGDWKLFPELRLLNRFDTVVPLTLGVGTYLLGDLLRRLRPGLGTSGPQMLIWGFCVSTVLLFHGTATINSLSHLFGSRRFDTPDTSRNNPLLALVTLGEGWHNNHHRYPVSARQGFFWYEADITYLVLKLMAGVGLIHDLSPVPERIYEEGKVRS